MLLYIDPGTGSMLFSILIGATATVFFLAKAAILKLKIFVSGKKAGTKKDASFKPFVIYSEGSNYWNTFLPIVNEFESRSIDLTFYTSSKDDPVFLQNYSHIKAEYIGEGNAAYAKLNMLQAGIVLMTTPGLGVYQLKRSRGAKYYAHILHMPNDATTYRLFGLDFFDAVLLTGDYQKEDIRLLEDKRGIAKKDLVTVGCAYLDVLSQKIASMQKNQEMPKRQKIEEENHKFTVLVSPSWGEVGVLKRYGAKLFDPLVLTGYEIIIRPHPQSTKVEKQMLDDLQKRYEDNPRVSWDYEKDNISSLSKADVMISDFSGIVFDYSFLFARPVIYAASDIDLRPYDAFDTGKPLWQFVTLEKIGTKLKEKDFPCIKEVIQKAVCSSSIQEAIQEAKNTAWQHQGEAGKRVVDFMVQKSIELETPKPAGKDKKSA